MNLRHAVCLVALLCLPLHGSSAINPDAEELAPGKWTLSTDGETFTLTANQVDIEELLSAIREMSPGDIRIKKMNDQLVTARYHNVSLDQLLTRLGLEYFLIYSRSAEGGEYKLESGWMSYAERVREKPAASPAMRAGPVVLAISTNSFDASVRERLGVGTNGVSTDTVGHIIRTAYPVAITLDGDINDWPEGLPWQKVTRDMAFDPTTNGVNNTTNDADASFEVTAVADAENLYIAIRITDDEKSVADMKNLSSKSDDSFELILDHRGSTLQAGQAPDVSFRVNRHHSMSRTVDGSIRVAPTQYVKHSSGTRAVIVDGPAGWNIEAVVPFSAFNFDATKSQQIGFNLVFRDNDSGKPQEKKLVWSSSQRAGGNADGDRTQLGTIQITDIR